MDRDKIIRGVGLILEGVGEDPAREGLKDTPARVADFYLDALSGVGEKADPEVKIYRIANNEEMIVVRDITFYSLCEHHLLPFFGKAHICYIPRENRSTGFSTLARIVEQLSRRPQMQERLTNDIADLLVRAIKPLGALVAIEAEHLCMTMRGVRKPGAKTVTSAIRGGMRRPATRAEAFALIRGT